MIQLEVCVTVTLLFDSINKTSVRKIFFLRPGAVGDILVATAALKEIATQFPQAEICVAGPAIWTQILHPELWPQVTSIMALKKNAMQGDIYFSNKVWTNSSTLSFPHSLWKTPAPSTAIPLQDWISGFDVFINLRLESPRYAWLARNVRYRFGTCPWPLQFLYTHWNPWLGRDPILHERDRLLEVLEAPPKRVFNVVSIKKARADLRFRQTGRADQKPNAALALQPKQNPQSLVGRWKSLGLPQLLPNSLQAQTRANLVLINPTASRWEKAWRCDKFCDLIDNLKAQFPKTEFAIIGSPQETDWLQTIAGDKYEVIQPKDFWELQIHLSRAQALIANCSSMQFFANASQTPTCTLLGRTFPARWGPLGPKDKIICGRMPDKPVRDIFLEDFLAYESLAPLDVGFEITPWLQSILATNDIPQIRNADLSEFK